MRLAALVAVVLWGCSDPPSPAISSLPGPAPAPEVPAETSAPSPTEPAATPSAEATPSSTARAPRLEIPAETSAEVRRLVREARALEHDGDHAGALSRFDAALRLVPSQPRISCEAGFIAHRAGDSALAARRIDAALAVFGEPRHVSDRLRVPLAMCLYNRGLVAEADRDPRRAVEAFEASIALRPNATVEAAVLRARAALAAAPAAIGPAADDTSTVGGVAMADDVYAIATTDVAVYERALRSGFRGVDWDGGYLPADRNEVTRRPLATDGHPSALVHTVATPDGVTRLVVSWPLAAGYQAWELELGREGEEGGDEHGLRVTEVNAGWAGSVLRLDVTVVQHTTTRLFYAGDGDDVRCEDGADEDVTRAWTVFCRSEVDPSVGEIFECNDFRTRVERSGVTSYSFCDDGGDDTEEHTPPTLARAVVTSDASGITISQVRDDDAELEVEEGRRDWDGAFIVGAGDVTLTEWISDQEIEDAAR